MLGQPGDADVVGLVMLGQFGMFGGHPVGQAGELTVDCGQLFFGGTSLWDVGSHGLRLRLSPDLTNLIERYLANDVTTFLDAHRLTKDDIGAWVSHPGGPKVIDAVATSLALPPEALELTWRSLGEIGNLSSASILHILRDTIEKRPPSGSAGLMLAMGPGFCTELVLLRWR